MIASLTKQLHDIPKKRFAILNGCKSRAVIQILLSDTYTWSLHLWVSQMKKKNTIGISATFVFPSRSGFLRHVLPLVVEKRRPKFRPGRECISLTAPKRAKAKKTQCESDRDHTPHQKMSVIDKKQSWTDSPNVRGILSCRYSTFTWSRLKSPLSRYPSDEAVTASTFTASFFYLFFCPIDGLAPSHQVYISEARRFTAWLKQHQWDIRRHLPWCKMCLQMWSICSIFAHI